MIRIEFIVIESISIYERTTCNNSKNDHFMKKNDKVAFLHKMVVFTVVTSGSFIIIILLYYILIRVNTLCAYC